MLYMHAYDSKIIGLMSIKKIFDFFLNVEIFLVIFKF